MKKFLVLFVVLAMLLSLTVPAFAAKPDFPPGQGVKAEKLELIKAEKEVRLEEQKEKTNGAVKYEFFLSGDVMPVPPYGSGDIEGSDEKSKLIVNQPEGKPIANVTGIMRGLTPNTDYNVFLGNGYEAYMVAAEWSLSPEFAISYLAEITAEPPTYSTPYVHDYVVNDQTDGIIDATGGYPSGGPYTITEIVNGEIIDDTLTWHVVYEDTTPDPEDNYWLDASFTIQPDGSLVGTWSNDTQTGTCSAPAGTAIKAVSGGTGYPGDLDGPPVEPFLTFTTNEEGHANFHFNMYCDMVTCEEGFEEFSVWINSDEPNRTVLISETVVLECDCEPEPEPEPDPIPE